MNANNEHIDDELQQMQETNPLKGSVHTAVRLADPISKLRLQETVRVTEDSSVYEAVELMRERRTGCLLVTREDRLVGIFTERDVVRKIVHQEVDTRKERVAAYMTSKPDTLKPGDPIAFALNFMAESGYRHVPLIDEDHRPQGFVSVRDIVNYIGDYFSRDLLNLPPKPQDDAWTSVEGG